MANQTVFADVYGNPLHLPVRTIGVADIKCALSRGYDDFRAMPSGALFVVVLYPVIALLLGKLAFGYQVLPLIFPIISGYALIGPLAAIGLYEMSRRRELGMRAHWGHAFAVIRSPANWAIATVGILLAVIFLFWVSSAQAIYNATLGAVPPASIADFVNRVLFSPEGWLLILYGNVAGFLFAVLAFAIGVVSFPLLLDREDVSAMTAILTSVRAVIDNPKPMALWGLIVASALLIGSLPCFVGLTVVLPVLGHASWHLYRKVVKPRGFIESAARF
jgi:uncharacterized membrane protein